MLLVAVLSMCILSVECKMNENRLKVLERKFATNVYEMSLLLQRTNSIEDRLEVLEVTNVSTQQHEPPNAYEAKQSDVDNTNEAIFKAFQAEKVQRLRLEGRCEELEKKLKQVEESSRLERHAMDEKISSVIDDIRELVASNTDSLNEKLNSYKSNAASRKEIADLLNKRKISFSARLSSNVNDLKTDISLIFDVVITNHGHAYSRTTGIFTAPMDGTYVFYVHILNTDRIMEIDLQKNNKRMMWLYLHGLSHGADGNMVVLQLAKGDRINVVRHSTWGEAPFYVHRTWTTFSGFMLHAN